MDSRRWHEAPLSELCDGRWRPRLDSQPSIPRRFPSSCSMTKEVVATGERCLKNCAACSPRAAQTQTANTESAAWS